MLKFKILRSAFLGKAVSMNHFVFLILMSSFLSSGTFKLFAKEPSSRIRSLYVQCTKCHGEKLEGNKELEAPALAGQHAWYLKEQLEYFKVGARGKKPKDYSGGKMYAMTKTLSRDDINLISDYIATLTPAKLTHKIRGNPAKGEQSFQICSTCHGKQAEGNKILHAPKLQGLNDWYIRSQLKKYQNELRGYDAIKAPLSAGMIGMSRTLVDDQAIDNVIDYILALQGQRGTGGESGKSKSK